MYSIEVESGFEQLWRYNIVVMCGGYSAGAEQLYVVTQEDIISPMESPIECEPEGYELPHKVVLQTDKADNIRVIIYVVPHTLPLGKEVGDLPEFNMNVKISKGKKVVYKTTHNVNQWSGASIEIKL